MPQIPSMPTVTATTLGAPPSWAILERKLIDLMTKGLGRLL